VPIYAQSGLGLVNMGARIQELDLSRYCAAPVTHLSGYSFIGQRVIPYLARKIWRFRCFHDFRNEIDGRRERSFETIEEAQIGSGYTTTTDPIWLCVVLHQQWNWLR